MQTLKKNWWLLALCGILETIISVIYLVMYDTGPNSYLTLHGWIGTVDFLNQITLAAGLFIGGTRILFEHSEFWLRTARPMLDALL